MLALLLWSYLKKAHVGITEGVLYANPNLTEHNLSLSSTLTHLFLVNYDYLKFLEMLTMCEKKRSHVLFLSPSLFGCEGRKLEATVVICFIKIIFIYFLESLNCIM